MNLVKRVLVFASINILIVATLSVVLSLLGISPNLQGAQLGIGPLAGFCLVWGFGGAFISLAMSRVMAKWMMGVHLVEENDADPAHAFLYRRVRELSMAAGLQTTPQVGVYESEELNAFATGPTKNRALVAVSTGLLGRMGRAELDGVLAHEVAHIANGDMVTMTLAQGVVNSLVMFIARVAAWFAGQAVAEERRPMVQFLVVLVSEILLGILGMVVLAAFSRYREFRADSGGARLSSTQNMVAALEALKKNSQYQLEEPGQPALASLKISGRAGWLSLFSTHPDLDDRIARLRNAGTGVFVG